MKEGLSVGFDDDDYGDGIATWMKSEELEQQLGNIWKIYVISIDLM